MTWFFGLDIHHDNSAVTAEDHELTVCDSVVAMTTTSWKAYHLLVEDIHPATLVHPRHVQFINSGPMTTGKEAAEASLPVSPVEKMAIELDLALIAQVTAHCERIEAFNGAESHASQYATEAPSTMNGPYGRRCDRMD